MFVFWLVSYILYSKWLSVVLYKKPDCSYLLYTNDLEHWQVHCFVEGGSLWHLGVPTIGHHLLDGDRCYRALENPVNLGISPPCRKEKQAPIKLMWQWKRKKMGEGKQSPTINKSKKCWLGHKMFTMLQNVVDFKGTWNGILAHAQILILLSTGWHRHSLKLIAVH